MDFARYAERAAELVNAPMDDPADLEEFLSDRQPPGDEQTDRDVLAVRRLQRELRPVFEASARGDEEQVVDRLNELLVKHPITPHIAAHGAQSWHLHVTHRSSSVAQLLTAEALIGLATLICQLGPTRLGVCQAERCPGVFLDTSPSRSRRYCSDRCSSRANVAAYRARQKASAG